jgi:ATP-dependent DNA helicase RecQ
MHPPTVQESPREIQVPARPHELTRTFAVGDVVRVRRYGEGTVEMVSGDRVAVRCSDDETRTFIARYVKRAASPEADRRSWN